VGALTARKRSVTRLTVRRREGVGSVGGCVSLGSWEMMDCAIARSSRGEERAGRRRPDLHPFRRRNWGSWSLGRQGRAASTPSASRY